MKLNMLNIYSIGAVGHLKAILAQCMKRSGAELPSETEFSQGQSLRTVLVSNIAEMQLWILHRQLKVKNSYCLLRNCAYFLI